MFEYAVFECLKKSIKEARLFRIRGLSIQLLMVLIAGLDCRLLTAFLRHLAYGWVLLQLDRLVKVTKTLNLDLLSQDLFYF